MKLANILFLAITEKEYEFLKYRHEIDSALFAFFSSRHTVEHLKLYEPGFNPQPADHEVYFTGSNRFFHWPLKLINHIRKHKPDVILVHGFVFPFQLLVLRWMISKKIKIIVQHHSEKPFINPVKRWVQKLAYSGVDAYLFTSRHLAAPYLGYGIIRDPSKIHEVMEGSTLFKKQDKVLSRKELGMVPGPVFLWVGRLDENKDPLLVLDAFRRYKNEGSEFKLYMIYGTSGLEKEVTQFIMDHDLAGCVVLVGKVPHAELETWYSAADYFVSASHYEGGGIAMCESMACGCVPIVTNIPSFVTMTNNGALAWLFEPGRVDSLLERLRALEEHSRAGLSTEIVAQFESTLSLPAIGKRIEAIALSLLQK